MTSEQQIDSPTATIGSTIAVPRWRSLAEGLNGRHNSFGIIRLVLASAVIFSHAFPLGGWGEDPLLAHSLGQENVGGIAVLGFFAISGYLIAKSGLNADPIQFIWRRILRIFPAYLVVLIVAAFIIGPIAWIIGGHSIGSYLSLGPAGPVQYVLLNADLNIRQWGVYDIFASTTPYGAIGGPVFNGSIWTLTYEWGSYLIIWILLIFGVLQRAKFLVLIITGFYFVAELASRIVPGSAGLILPYFGDHYRVSLPLIFLYGACLALYAKRVPLDWRLAALAAIVAVLTLWKGGLTVLGYPAIAYLVMWLAAALPQRFHWIGAKNDYSYGIYLYGFLIEQFLAFLGVYRWGYIPFTLASLAVSAGFAWLSWHGIEKRSLALKDLGPGRGFRPWVESVRGRINSRPKRVASGKAAPTTTSGALQTSSPAPAPVE